MKVNPYLNQRTVYRHEELGGLYVTSVTTEKGHEIHISSENTEDGEEIGILIECCSNQEVAAAAEKIATIFASISQNALNQSFREKESLENQFEIDRRYFDAKPHVERINESELAVQNDESGASIANR